MMGRICLRYESSKCQYGFWIFLREEIFLAAGGLSVRYLNRHDSGGAPYVLTTVGFAAQYSRSRTTGRFLLVTDFSVIIVAFLVLRSDADSRYENMDNLTVLME